MHKSVFSEFVFLCLVVFLSTIVSVGSVMLLAANENYKLDKRTAVSHQSRVIAEAARSAVSEQGAISGELAETIELISKSINADITLTDSDGVALVCTEASPCSHTGKKIDVRLADDAPDGELCELSTMNGYYDSDRFFSLRKFTADNEPYYVLVTMTASELPRYTLKTVLTLIVVSTAILSVAFLIVYISSKNILEPVKDMTIAARRFGKGDFSEKIKVTEENDLGFLAATLNEMAASLEQIVERRDNFVSNVSHELKTPMTTIGGFVDGILDGTIPKEKQHYYLRIVSDEVKRLSKLVRSMLNISKYESGEIKLKTEDIDLLPIIVQTLLNFEKRIDEKKVEIRGLEIGGFHLTADADLIGQVVYNLVENAVKFVNEGGYISFIFNENENGEKSVSIRNSGEGLSKKEISKVFDRFYKTDESRGMDPTGVGLGLPIVSSIIKLHGGNILVASEPGEYTEFTFTVGSNNAV